MRIYRSLQSLRKDNHRKKIVSIRIRGTNIYCKTEVDDNFVHVSSQFDVEDIRKKLEVTAVPHDDDNGSRG